MTGRVETVLPEPWIRGMDVTEVLAQGNFGNLYIRRGSWPFTISRSAPLLASSFTAIGGGGIAGTAYAPFRQDGAWWWRGVSGLNWTSGRYLEDFQFPIGQDLSIQGAAGRQPMEYTWEAEVSVPGGAPPGGTPFHFGVFSENASFVLSVLPGFCFVADGSLSANWLVLRRARAAGALVTVDTGIPVATMAYMRIRYRNTDNPRISAELNGVEVASGTGLANVPQQANAGVINWKLGFGQGNIAASTAGVVSLIRNCRIWAQELAGYE